MEEYSYSWILKTVSNRQCLLPFLPTYITTDPKNIIYLSNTDNKLSITHTSFKSLKDLFSKLLSESQYKIKFHSSELLICYAITKTERLRLKEHDLKEVQETLCKTGCLFIQPARPRACDYEVYYILRLEYTRSKYISSFYKQVNYEKNKFYDSRIFEATCDIANTLMSIVENQTKKRVMIIEVEFLEDIDRMIWVSFVRDLKIAEPILCLHYMIKNTNDLKTIPIKSSGVTKFTKLTNGQHVQEKKQFSKPPIDYTFSKGRIRNRKSDINLDLTIQPPDITEEKEIPIRSCNSPVMKSLSIRKSIIHKASTPQPRSPPRIESMKAQYLKEELMKSPELKTKYRLYGLIGILGIEMKRNHKRSLSDSEMQEESKPPPRRARPKSRLIIREYSGKKVRTLTPNIMSAR